VWGTVGAGTATAVEALMTGGPSGAAKAMGSDGPSPAPINLVV
jgi:hypothetical protein